MHRMIGGYGPIRPAVASGGESPRQLIFHQVRAAGRMARISIAKQLGISPATVTTLTSELIAQGLIEEVHDLPPQSDLRRGRPPVSLQLKADTHYVAGIKISDTSNMAVILDFEGSQIAEISLPRTPGADGTEELLSSVEDTLDQVLMRAKMQRSDLSAIGIGVPGVVDSAQGVAHWCPILKEADTPLRDMLAARLNRPVFLDNDVNLVALAELWFGVGRGLRDFLVVTIEHGVGMGVVLNNRLFRGTRGRGMEFGHIKVQPDGALCRCGQRGCLEAYVADYALLREASTAMGWPIDNKMEPQVALESLFAAAKGGNVAARSIFERAGRYFSMGLATLVNIFDPALIILAGERMRYDFLYAETVMEQMKANILQSQDDPPELRVHKWGDLLWAKGAAALALEGVTDAALAADAGGEAQSA